MQVSNPAMVASVVGGLAVAAGAQHVTSNLIDDQGQGSTAATYLGIVSLVGGVGGGKLALVEPMAARTANTIFAGSAVAAGIGVGVLTAGIVAGVARDSDW